MSYPADFRTAPQCPEEWPSPNMPPVSGDFEVAVVRLAAGTAVPKSAPGVKIRRFAGSKRGPTSGGTSLYR